MLPKSLNSTKVELHVDIEEIPCMGAEKMQSLLKGPKKVAHLGVVSVTLITVCE